MQDGATAVRGTLAVLLSLVLVVGLNPLPATALAETLGSGGGSAESTSGAAGSGSDTEDTIHFEGNGATSGSMSDQKVNLSKKTELAANAFSRSGYRFKGWSTTKDNKTVKDDPSTSADDEMLATFLTGDAKLLEQVASCDTDGDGDVESLDLRSAFKSGKLVLYTQWEKAGSNKTLAGAMAAKSRKTSKKHGELVPASGNSDNGLADISDIDDGEANGLVLEISDAGDAERSSSAAAVVPTPKRAAKARAAAADADNPTDGKSKIAEVKLQWQTDDNARALGQEVGADGNITVTTKSNDPQSLRAQLDVQLDGAANYDAGAIQIVLPGHIFTKRDGKTVAGNLVMPLAENPSLKTEFNWSYDASADTYTLTSTRRVAGSAQIKIQMDIENLRPSDLVDSKTSDPFKAKVYLNAPSGNLLTKTSNAVTAKFNTEETTPSAAMGGNAKLLKAEDVPEEYRTEGETDYIVVTHYSYAALDGNTNFDLSWEASLPENDPYGGKIMSGETGTAMENGWTSGNSRYAYVTVVYPASKVASANGDESLVPGKSYHFDGTSIEWTLTQVDPKDGQAGETLVTTSTASDKVTCTVPVHEQRFIPYYAYGNWGDDNDDAYTVHSGDTRSTSNRSLSLGLPANYNGVYPVGINELDEGGGLEVRYEKTFTAQMIPDQMDVGDDHVLKSGAKTPVTIVFEDGDYALSGNGIQNTPLAIGRDYGISSLTVCAPKNVKAPKVDGNVVDYGDATARADYPDTIVSARVSGEWQNVQTIKWEEQGDQVEVSLPAGADRWRVTEVCDPDTVASIGS